MELAEGLFFGIFVKLVSKTNTSNVYKLQEGIPNYGIFSPDVIFLFVNECLKLKCFLPNRL